MNVSCEKCKKIFTISKDKDLERDDTYPCPFCGTLGIFVPRLEPVTLDGVLIEKMKHRKDKKGNVEDKNKEEERDILEPNIFRKLRVKK